MPAKPADSKIAPPARIAERGKSSKANEIVGPSVGNRYGRRPSHFAIRRRYAPGHREKGFIAKQSSHSRGSAVDLTLINVETGRDLDMGSGFDYFDDISNTDSNRITAIQKTNRMMLKNLMESKGFKNFSQEWWHFSFRPEPYPDQSFDFDVE